MYEGVKPDMSQTKPDVATQVAQIVGVDGVLPAAELPAHAVDGLVPQAVALPANVEQVSRLVAFANEQGLAVIPRGGGTAMGLGGIPRRADIVIGLRRMKRVIAYSPSDMTVTVQAGITLDELQSMLAGHGQMLPLDPPLPDRATIGGILASAASGPLRIQFGLPRDLALGMRVVTADGAITKSGGIVVKNVAGYDMTRLHVGALGTLGVIVEATFKVVPIAKTLVTVAGSFATPIEALAAAHALRMARIVPWSLVLLPPGVLRGLVAESDGQYVVAVRLGGMPEAIGPQAQRATDAMREAGAVSALEVARAEESFWPAVRDWPATVGNGEGVLVRVGILPSQAQTVLAAAQDIAARLGVPLASLVFPATALVYMWSATTPAVAEASGDAALQMVKALAAIAGEWNGTAVVERCPKALKEQVSVWGPSGRDFAVLRRIKETFDPKGTLNPGRFVGGL